MSQANRVRWHSRRGMLELDVLLVPFAEQAFDGLTEEDKALYVRLLECEDPDLFAWFMEHQEPQDSEFKRMIRMVLEHGRTAK